VTLNLTSSEILDLHGGVVSDSVREKIRPLAESVIDGTFSDRKDSLLLGSEKYCQLVLEGKATVSAFSQTYLVKGLVSTDITIISLPQ
jgi:hypothetical protein